MLSSRHAPRRWKRRYGFGKGWESHSTLRRKAATIPARMVRRPPGFAGVLRTRRRRFAVTASQRHGLPMSEPCNVVSKIAQARTSQLKPKIGIILGTTRPTRFSEKAAQWLANIAKQRDDAEFEVVDLRLSDAVLRGREIADVSAAEERDRVALGQEDGGARRLHLCDSRVQSRPAFRAQERTRLCLCRIQSQAGYIRRLWKRGSRTSGGTVAPGSCGIAGGHARSTPFMSTPPNSLACSCTARPLPISPISASRSLQCWKIWCGGQMSSRPGVNRQRTRSPFQADRSISLTLHTSMR